MSDFNAKMHQIQFRLGLRPRPRWGAYSAPDLLAGFKGPTSKRGERERVGNGTVGGEMGRRNKGMERKGGKLRRGRGR